MWKEVLMHKQWKHSSKAMKKVRLALRRCLRPIVGKCTMGVDISYRKCCGRDGSDTCHYLPGHEKK